jgi:poly(A) polymerase
VDEDGIEHFYGHEREGEFLARSILERYKFPKKNIDRICHAVGNHMRFAHVDKMREAKLRRLIADPDFPLELELHRVDCASSHNKLGNYILLLDRFSEMKNEPALPEPFIDGNDLLSLGFKPGPEIGLILKEAVDMQLEGKIKNKADALRFASGKL